MVSNHSSKPTSSDSLDGLAPGKLSQLDRTLRVHNLVTCGAPAGTSSESPPIIWTHEHHRLAGRPFPSPERPSVSYRNLSNWLDDFDPHDCDPEVLLPLVESAIEDVQQRHGFDEVLEQLFDIEDLLEQGEPCGDKLEALFADHPELPPLGLDEIAEQYLTLADELTDEEWQTTTYAQLVDLIDCLETDQHEEARRLQQALNGIIEGAWQVYSQTLVHDDEVTLQAVAGHRLLLQGAETWRQALVDVKDGRYDDALENAEDANRILISLQRFARQVERQTEHIT